MIKKISLFVVFKYVNFVVKGAKGLLIAKVLGPHGFGIWAFLQMVEKYIAYKNFGLYFTLNIELSNNFEDKDFARDYVSKCVNIYVLISLIVFVLTAIFYLLDINIAEKYRLKDFIFILVILATLRNFEKIYANIFRVYNKLKLIIVSEFLLHTLPLLTILFFDGIELIYALLIASVFSLIISISFYSYYSPLKISYFRFFNADSVVDTNVLLKNGFMLLLINVSVYLFNLSSKTFVSTFYSVEQMGYFSFAISITMASLFGMKAARWAIYPNILKKLSSIDERLKLRSFVDKIERMNSYLLINFIHIIILLTPLLFWFFPEYLPANNVLLVLLVAQGIVSMGLGYNTFIMNRKLFKQLVVSNLVALSVVLVGNYFLAFFQVNLLHIGQVILVAYFIVLVGMNFIYRRKVFGEGLIKSFRSLDYYKLLHMFVLGSVVSFSNFFILVVMSLGLFNFFHFSDYRLVKNFFKSGSL